MRGASPGIEAGQRGFTLVELMVALLIFSMISAAGVMLLSASVKTQAAVSEKLDALAAQQRLNAVLTNDLAQALPRTNRNGAGDRAPAFQAGPQGFPLIFVRSGWSNPTGASRSNLQKVEYRLQEGRLERLAYAMTDGAEVLEPSIFLENASDARLRFRVKGEWRESWDPERADALPDALELTMGGANVQTRQLFLVGNGI